MKTAKLNLLIVCGGRSAEHEVSLNSALNIVRALNPERYNVTLIAIDKNGFWQLLESTDVLAKAASERALPFHNTSSTVTLVNGKDGVELFDLVQKKLLGKVDLVFPVLHGPYGEDGAIQGFFKTLGLAFVGSGVLGSAVCMDKEVTKRMLRDAGLPIGKFLVLRKNQEIRFSEVEKALGSPVFVKPANMGSSIGVYKVENEQQWQKAVSGSFQYDHKLIIEAMINGRELECSVLGNRSPQASVVGEILAHHDFYSYEAKYLDADGASLVIPAKMPQPTMEKMRELAIKAFQTLCCEGLARVDFFLSNDGVIYINEINTLPGFTNISMYPKMWEVSGIKYSALIDYLVDLALERHNRDQELKVDC